MSFECARAININWLSSHTNLSDEGDNGPSERTSAGCSRPHRNAPLGRPPGNVSRDVLLHPLPCVTDTIRPGTKAEAVVSFSKVLPVPVWHEPLRHRCTPHHHVREAESAHRVQCARSLWRRHQTVSHSSPSRRRLILFSFRPVMSSLNCVWLPICCPCHCYLARCLVIYHDQCQVELLHCTAHCSSNLIISL